MPVTATERVDLRVYAEQNGNELPIVCGAVMTPNADLFVQRNGDVTTMCDRIERPQKDLVFCQSPTVAAIPPATDMTMGMAMMTDDIGRLPLAITDPLRPTYIPTTRLQTRVEVAPEVVAQTTMSQEEVIEHEKANASIRIAREVAKHVGEPATHETISRIAEQVQGAIQYTVTPNPVFTGFNTNYQELQNSIGVGTLTTGYNFTTSASTIAYNPTYTYDTSITGGGGGYTAGTGIALGEGFTTTAGGYTLNFAVNYADTTAVTNTSYGLWTQQSLKEQIKSFIQSNLMVRTGSKSISSNITPEEQKARHTLRDLISEKDWRRYVTNGFVMVKGHSGYFYQVFSDGRNLKVYKDNKMTHTLCIHTDKSVCATDHVINMKLLIELDEAQIWAGSNATAWDNESSDRKLKAFLKDNLAKSDEPVLLSHFKNLKKNPQGLVLGGGSIGGISYNTFNYAVQNIAVG